MPVNSLVPTRGVAPVVTIDRGKTRFVLGQADADVAAVVESDGWNKRGDVWQTPAGRSELRRLLRKCPNVQVTYAVRVWLASHLLAPYPPFAWNPDLHDYQRRAVMWLAKRRSGLAAISPGLGKTAVAITALQVRGVQSTVVVCPLTLLSVWKREAARWWPSATVVDRTDGAVHSLLPGAEMPLLRLVTYDELRLYGLPFQPDALVFDESVLFKSRPSHRKDEDGKRVRTGLRSSAAEKARSQAPICWMLSGSPTTRYHDDLWHQLHILEPDQYGSYWRFMRRYCVLRQTIWNPYGEIVGNLPGAERMMGYDLQDIFFTYGYADLARERPDLKLPEADIETVEVPLPHEWWRIYQQMQRQFVADLPSRRLLAPNSLAKMVRLLQLASNPALLEETGQLANVTQNHLAGQSTTVTHSSGAGKSAALKEVLSRLPEPTIVWTNFVATAHSLGHALKAPVLIGETPVPERARVVAEFQEGHHAVLVAHPGVGRFGLTLHRARSAVYIERSFDGDAYYQSLHRIRRLGMTEEPRRVVNLLACGPKGERTVDHVVDRVLAGRADAARKLTTALVKEVLGGG